MARDFGNDGPEDVRDVDTQQQVYDSLPEGLTVGHRHQGVHRWQEVLSQTLVVLGEVGDFHG